mgnify:CR=1 FL=1
MRIKSKKVALLGLVWVSRNGFAALPPDVQQVFDLLADSFFSKGLCPNVWGVAPGIQSA